MHKIIGLPSYANTQRNLRLDPILRQRSNSFVKRKKWIVDIMMNRQFKLWRKFNPHELKEIENNCLIELWQAYILRPDANDGYFFIAIKRYIQRELMAKARKRIYKAEVETVEMNEVEFLCSDPRNIYKEIDSKIRIEKIERELSEESKKILLFSLIYSNDRPNNKSKTAKQNFSKQMKSLGVTKKKIKSFKIEIQQAMACIHKVDQTPLRDASRLIAQELAV